jgi:PIN domain nuclease of toxin-antitoxin system
VTAVVDASALRALLFEKPGAQAVAEVIAEGATASMVNLAEVATVLTSNRRDPSRVLEAVRAQVELAPFSAADALAVAALYPQVSGRGTPLGDRACLALARRLDAPAVTAGHLRIGLSLDIAVQLIRPARG